MDSLRHACRWELDAVEKLPDYMKKSFRVLYDTTNQTVEFIAKNHGGSINIPDVSLSLQKAVTTFIHIYIYTGNMYLFIYKINFGAVGEFV